MSYTSTPVIVGVFPLTGNAMTACHWNINPDDSGVTT